MTSTSQVATPQVAGPSTAQVLQRCRDQVEPSLRAAVAQMDVTSAAIAAYHLGWTDTDGRAVIASGGKSVRATLAVLSAQAVGPDATVGVPGAVAVELVHNFSLLHDDVIDGDTTRRHRPTAWTVWGVPKTILAGDAMLALAHDVLLTDPTPSAVAADRQLSVAVTELIRGQMEDVDFEQRTDVGLAECQAMAAGKTGALLVAAATIGAVLAGAEPDVVAALADYGADVGVAFQLVDDLLGIWGDSAATGKPVLSDLRSRKKSLPITYVLSAGGPGADELAAFLATAGPDDDADLERVAALVEDAGAREWVRTEADRRVDSARAALERVQLEPRVRGELADLAQYVVGRDT